jgi:hypothetical protein
MYVCTVSNLYFNLFSTVPQILQHVLNVNKILSWTTYLFVGFLNSPFINRRYWRHCYLRQHLRFIRLNDGREVGDLNGHGHALDAADAAVDDDVARRRDDVVAAGSRLVDRAVAVLRQVGARPGAEFMNQFPPSFTDKI